MKFIATSTLVLALLPALTSAGTLRHKHARHAEVEHSQPKKRSGQCQFPTNAGLVSVTPDQENAGWAMSPNQPCKPGMYCPYACPAGQVGLQWDPEATSYTYPLSMNGGLYCNEDGEIEKPFPEKGYCSDGVGSAIVNNTCGQVVSFCQTVLPGNEAMLIPTEINSGSNEIIAVPDPSYWVSTAAHYYINPPGVGTEEGCVWGAKDKPIGNWSPYVAGANTDSSGNTYVKIGWNPIYIEPDVTFRDERPSFGVRLVCDGDCVGLGCEINPADNAVNEVNSEFSAYGAGGAAFCIGTAQPGSKIYIEVFEVDGSSSSSSGSSSTNSGSSSSAVSSAASSVSASASASVSSSNPEISSSSAAVSSSKAGSSSDSSNVQSSSASASTVIQTAISLSEAKSSIAPTATEDSTYQSSFIEVSTEINPAQSTSTSDSGSVASGLLSSVIIPVPVSESSAAAVVTTSAAAAVTTSAAAATTAAIVASSQQGSNEDEDVVYATVYVTNAPGTTTVLATVTDLKKRNLETYAVESVSTLVSGSRAAVYNLASSQNVSLSSSSSQSAVPVTTSGASQALPVMSVAALTFVLIAGLIL